MFKKALKDFQEKWKKGEAATKPITQKRYQYRSANGKVWTKWFNYEGKPEFVQLKGFKGDDLLNEYR